MRLAHTLGPVAVLLSSIGPAYSQSETQEAKPPEELRSLVVAEQFRASGLHNFLLGRDYRDLWTATVKIEVLNLRTFAGGLTPVKRVGGQETKGLAMKGADGRDWTFRSIVKDPSGILPPDLQGTIAQKIVLDQIAAAHPAGPLMVDPFLEAAGILHAGHRLVVMPDDPALGEFRTLFAGWVGTVEEYPGGVSATNPGFHGATEVVNHKEFYKRLEAGPSDRADSVALLRARLVDLLVGDWDRHRDQWRWAKIPGKALWQPIPEDRDQAFCRFEGIVLTFARGTEPRFLNFGADYPGLDGSTENGREQDRWLLTDLEKPAWDEAAADLKAKITDAVIDEAVRTVPAEYYGLEGPRLARELKARRDHLPEEATMFYRHLAGDVDIHATDQSELIEIQRFDDGDLEVKMTAQEAGGPSETPYYHRRFHRGETREVRIYVHGGTDRVVTHGRSGGITVRVIGGKGNVTLDDSGGGGTEFSFGPGGNRVIPGPGTKQDEKPYVPPPPDKNAPWVPPVDSGEMGYFGPYIRAGSDEGLVAGASFTRIGYGFRQDPWSSYQFVHAAYVTSPQTFRFQYDGRFRRPNSGVQTHLAVEASGIDVLRFYGFGNETSSAGPDETFRVKRQLYSFAPDISFELAPPLRFAIGPVVKYSRTTNNDGRLIAVLAPYGSGKFGQVGAASSLRLDTRDHTNSPTKGVLAEAAGSYYPGVWDAKTAFGEVHGSAATYLSAGGYVDPTLALRGGGKRVFGDHPFYESAFIGSAFTGEDATVRGLRGQRYAGDSSLYANAELRLFLTKFYLVLPGELGVFGLADMGRVYLKGETSNKWHQAYGGGLWFSFLGRQHTVTVTVARCEQQTGLYLHGGFAF